MRGPDRPRCLAASSRLLFLAGCLLAAQARAAGGQKTAGEWTAYTSMASVRTLLAVEQTLWASTNGGVLRYDTRDQSYRRFTRLDGLAGNLITSVAADARGHLWFGTDHQGLSRYRPEASAFDPPFMDFGGRSIHALLPHGDYLFVATDRGISAFATDKEEVKENYRQLGTLPKDSEVHALVVFAGKLWAGTEGGIAAVDLDCPNMQDPDNWISLATGRVRAFLVHNDTLFCGTRYGIWRLARDDSRPSPELVGVPCARLESHRGEVHAADDDGGLWRRPEARNWQRVADVTWNVTALARVDSALWLGTENGLRVLGAPQPPPLGGPPANSFYEMTKAPTGELWIASVPKDNVEGRGAYEFDGENWFVHDPNSGLPSSMVCDLAVDAAGGIWAGSWGKGLAIRGPGGAWQRLDQTNSLLGGCCGGGSYVVVTDIQRDADGVMWVGNVHVGLIAMDGYPPTRALLYGQRSIGLGAQRDMGEFAIGADGIKWITTPLDGFVLFDDGGTPFVAGDEYAQVFNTLTETRLTSDRTTAVLAGADGRLWIGTDNGLNSIVGEYQRATRTFRIDSWRVYSAASGLPSNYITALAADGRGNVWVGTEAGLAQISAATGSVAFALTTSNSGLIDNRINALFHDSDAGELWIGTLNGLSRLRLGRTGDDGTQRPLVYPNPLLLGARPARLTFANLPPGARLAIHGLDGQLVRTLACGPGEASVTWDGLNQAGYLVASGVYLFVATGEDGQRCRGRLAVIHAR